ncbi:plexin domain-containing protein 2-like [Mytilus californianus]|uniref:plexin domain-containing protein 2-like n=1 Tax=Mytilus californianus TaxID=6549 RepID=UPI0022458736|nr:plexin domain-containing protein 2-like [Mytilus californianus]
MEFLLYFCFSFAFVVMSTNLGPNKVIYKGHNIVKRQEAPPDNTTTISDHHDYYTSKIISDPDGAYWNELEGHTRHILSNDHRRKYSFIWISFKFPFYGRPIYRFAITTQGFLYMSNFTHPKLDWTFTHYIAPLMGNFDTIGNDSEILYKDDGHSFVVEWRNVELNDQPEKGPYTYQTTLFENGTILFAYKSVPDTDIFGKLWPVKVGVSDAFYFDRDSPFGGYTRFIVRYHLINLNVTYLTNNTAVVLDPLPTCNEATTCENCTSLNIGFNCSWCHAASKCSSGMDWHRQNWRNNRCDAKAVDTPEQCPIPTKIPTTTTSKPTTPATPTKPTTIISTKPSAITAKPTTTIITTTTTKPTTSTSTEISSTAASATVGSDAVRSKKDSKSKTAVVVPLVVVLVVILILCGAWIFYARTHPNTRSGIWLIEHSPRKMKEKFSGISFFKNSKEETHSKYGVQSDSSTV